jgi:hypothetical protein
MPSLHIAIEEAKGAFFTMLAPLLRIELLTYTVCTQVPRHRHELRGEDFNARPMEAILRVPPGTKSYGPAAT